MKLAIAVLLIAFPAAAALAQAPVRVQGYVTKNGTYVAPHYRSAPNSTKFDNYSTRGNYNPYTGQRGTTDPYGLPSTRQNSYPAPRSSYYPSTTPRSSSYGSFGSDRRPSSSQLGGYGNSWQQADDDGGDE